MLAKIAFMNTSCYWDLYLAATPLVMKTKGFWQFW